MLHHSPLGRETEYKSEYSPDLLFSIPRRMGRDAIGAPDVLPFDGVDVWNAYELSWLNGKGKPQVAVAELTLPATSQFLVESKSLKLYLNSLNGTRFASKDEVQACIRRDVSKSADGPVDVRLLDRQAWNPTHGELEGECVDDLDVSIDTYDVAPAFLA